MIAPNGSCFWYLIVAFSGLFIIFSSPHLSMTDDGHVQVRGPGPGQGEAAAPQLHAGVHPHDRGVDRHEVRVHLRHVTASLSGVR